MIKRPHATYLFHIDVQPSQGCTDIYLVTRTCLFLHILVCIRLKKDGRTSKTSLLNIPHVDYGDVIYDQAYNKSFHEKLENFHCNASLAITGAIRGTSKEKLYQELGFESLQHRRWFHKLCAFYKIFKNQSPRYLYELLLIKTTPRNTRSSINLPFFYIKYNFFKNSFFPSAVIEWNNLDLSIPNSESLSIF